MPRRLARTLAPPVQKMKTIKPLWRVSVVTAPEAEDAVSELLGAVLGQPVSSHFNLETGACTVMVYCEQRPASFQSARKQILAGLMQIKQCGLKIGPGKVILSKVRRENWTESWKRHFKPIEIGDALLIKPSGAKNCHAKIRRSSCWTPDSASAPASIRRRRFVCAHWPGIEQIAHAGHF